MSIPTFSPEKNNTDLVLADIQSTNKMCQALMQTPHYKKIGLEGMFAITQKARTLNVNPLDALNGGLYFVNGKVEMSSQMMIQLIRQAGHSVTKDKRSDDTICILHGKRKDNGDTWTESFSIEDAKRAGIYKNVWEKYPRNMMFARALSNLARQLFPDTIKGCYVEGEISSHSFDSKEGQGDSLEQVQVEVQKAKLDDLPRISDKQCEELEALIGEDTEYLDTILSYIHKKYKAVCLRDMPLEVYERAYTTALHKYEERQNSLYADHEPGDVN
jgi:hypothetical protein